MNDLQALNLSESYPVKPLLQILKASTIDFIFTWDWFTILVWFGSQKKSSFHFSYSMVIQTQDLHIVRQMLCYVMFYAFIVCLFIAT